MATYNELKQSNQTAKFWELEEPEVLNTPKNTIRYYPKAERLVVHLPDYFDSRVREIRPGKGVGLDLHSLREQPETVARLIAILKQLQKS